MIKSINKILLGIIFIAIWIWRTLAFSQIQIEDADAIFVKTLEYSDEVKNLTAAPRVVFSYAAATDQFDLAQISAQVSDIKKVSLQYAGAVLQRSLANIPAALAQLVSLLPSNLVINYAAANYMRHTLAAHLPVAVVPVDPADGDTIILPRQGVVTNVLWVRWPRSRDPDGDPVSYRWELGDPSVQQIYLRRWTGSDTTLALPYERLRELMDSLGGSVNSGLWLAHRVVVQDGTLLPGGGRAEVVGAAVRIFLALGNSVPETPILVYPVGEIIEIAGAPDDTLRVAWWSVRDPDGDPVYYRWDLALDSLFTQVVLSKSVGRDTLVGLSYRELADLLDFLGVSLGQQKTFYHRVLATDSVRFGGGDITEVVGPTAPLVLVRGQLTFVEEALPEQFAFRGHYPSPAQAGVIDLILDLPVSSHVSVEVYDILGRMVLRMPGVLLEAGWGRHLRLVVDDLAAGMYVYRVLVKPLGGERRVFTSSLIRVH